MHVLFCASADLKDAKYIRKGNKNLLQTKFGICDTIAMCGNVVDCKRTKFGVMLTLNDGENFVITAGTFNEMALHAAVNVLQKFSEGNEEIYLLIYANPFCKKTINKIYLNANQDYSVIEVTRQVYEKFHEIRKKGLMYLTEKFSEKDMMSEKEKDEEVFDIFEMSEAEYKKQIAIDLAIVQFVENLTKNKKDNVIELEEVVSELEKSKNFSYLNINFTDKIYELLELGYFYEPKPGYIKVVR